LELRELIFRMVAENPTWGAPRIHGELLMLGFDISERTISRWMKRAPRDPEPGKRWLAFLRFGERVCLTWLTYSIPKSWLSCLESGGREGIRTPGLLVANDGENKLRQGATIT